MNVTTRDIETIRNKQGFICDMDGVLYHGNRLLPGAREFVAWLRQEKKQFLFLTNSSERSPKELDQKLARLVSTAQFARRQYQQSHPPSPIVSLPGCVEVRRGLIQQHLRFDVLPTGQRDAARQEQG